MSYVPTADAQAMATAAGNNMAANGITAWQSAISGGNQSPAIIFDAIKTFATFIEVGSGGGAPAFQNSWVNFGGGLQTMAFMRDATGFVHLKGCIKSGTVNTAVFNLPAGYRPAAQCGFATVSNNLLGLIIIAANGDVILQIGNNAYAYFDGVTFFATQ